MNRFPNDSQAFTLAEVMVVIAVAAILSVLTYAPYSYYSDLSRVRLSSEKVEQAFSEAKLSASMGLAVPGTDFNADAYVLLEEGSGSVGLFAARSGSGFAPVSEFRLLRDVPLEKDVTISDLPSETVVVKFSAPSGTASAVDGNGLPVVFSGGLVGLKGVTSGSLSRNFRSVSAY
jgi:prepilin-type N-terminal cleavage/methylation domain-containing protein